MPVDKMAPGAVYAMLKEIFGDKYAKHEGFLVRITAISDNLSFKKNECRYADFAMGVLTKFYDFKSENELKDSDRRYTYEIDIMLNGRPNLHPSVKSNSCSVRFQRDKFKQDFKIGSVFNKNKCDESCKNVCDYIKSKIE